MAEQSARDASSARGRAELLRAIHTAGRALVEERLKVGPLAAPGKLSGSLSGSRPARFAVVEDSQGALTAYAEVTVPAENGRGLFIDDCRKIAGEAAPGKDIGTDDELAAWLTARLARESAEYETSAEAREAERRAIVDRARVAEEKLFAEADAVPLPPTPTSGAPKPRRLVVRARSGDLARALADAVTASAGVRERFDASRLDPDAAPDAADAVVSISAAKVPPEIAGAPGSGLLVTLLRLDPSTALVLDARRLAFPDLDSARAAIADHALRLALRKPPG